MTDPTPRPVAEVIPLEYSPSVRLQWASVAAAHNAKAGPLYDQAALDAAVASERQRCAEIVRSVMPHNPTASWEAARLAIVLGRKVVDKITLRT